jgi:hypothetical protein
MITVGVSGLSDHKQRDPRQGGLCKQRVQFEPCGLEFLALPVAFQGDLSALA